MKTYMFRILTTKQLLLLSPKTIIPSPGSELEPIDETFMSFYIPFSSGQQPISDQAFLRTNIYDNDPS